MKTCSICPEEHCAKGFCKAHYQREVARKRRPYARGCDDRKRELHTGWSRADYSESMAKQGGLCAICGQSGTLCADHDHNTGMRRGLLCMSCNQGIGKFKDDPEILRRAIAYLTGEKL